MKIKKILKYIDEINLYSNLYDKISSAMARQAYPSWDICVNEHIVRAVTARLICINNGQEAFNEQIEYEKAKLFLYRGFM